jgi:hypothetical protein
VTIRLSGPADVWFGVGIGAATHAADPSDPSTGLSMLGTNWTVGFTQRPIFTVPTT